MKDDLIGKIESIITKKGQIDEDNILSLMVLIRKLLDKMQQSDMKSFLTLLLFCNWTVHNEITQSNTGLRILSEINDALVRIKNVKDNNLMQILLSQAIGFSKLRGELKLFFNSNGIDDILTCDNNIWINFVCNLIKIILDVPLSFPHLSKLDPAKQKIYNQIAQNPIKPGTGVISIKISEIDYGTVGKYKVGKKKCLCIRTEDTTTIIVPLLPRICVST
jgi:hypothetical protein